MDFSASTVWWLASGVLVATELASGTFYLLMVAIGCAAGAVAAHGGVQPSLQIISAAVVGVAATTTWHFRRRRGQRVVPAASDRNVNLDIGQRVNVPAWTPEGCARVHYRGSDWAVRFEARGQPAPGEHVIVALDGNELRVAPAASH